MATEDPALQIQTDPNSPHINKQIHTRTFSKNSPPKTTIENFEKMLEAICEAFADHYNYQLGPIFAYFKKQLPKSIKKLLPQKYKRAIKRFNSFLHTRVFPALINVICEAKGISFAEGWERLWNIFVRHAQKKGMPVLINKFSINGIPEKTFISEDKPVSRYTDDQITKLPKAGTINDTHARAYFKSCYDRGQLENNEGLSAFRQITFGAMGFPIFYCQYFHFSSPIPYHIADENLRLEITERNVQQFVSVSLDEKVKAESLALESGTVQKHPVCLLRLLSPLQLPHRQFDPDQKQYQQILETVAAAASINNQPFSDTLDSTNSHVQIQPDVSMFVFGTNMFRGAYHELQIHINAPSFNKLFVDVLKSLNCLGLTSNFDPALKKAIRETVTAYKQKKEKEGKTSDISLSSTEIEIYLQALKDKLNEEIQAKKKETINQRNFAKILAQHYESYHRKLNEAFTTLWEEQFLFLESLFKKINTSREQHLIFGDFAFIMRLLKDKKWVKYNYELQAALVRLMQRLNIATGTGCNDAKDRDGFLTVAIQAQEIFRIAHGRYADPENDIEWKELSKIRSGVYVASTPRYSAEAISIPGADDCNLRKSDVNLINVEPRAFLAAQGKEIFKPSLFAKAFFALDKKIKAAKERKNFLGKVLWHCVSFCFIAMTKLLNLEHANTVIAAFGKECCKNRSKEENNVTAATAPISAAGAVITARDWLEHRNTSQPSNLALPHITLHQTGISDGACGLPKAKASNTTSCVI